MWFGLWGNEEGIIYKKKKKKWGLKVFHVRFWGF